MKSLDMFGIPIQFQFDKELTYATTCGFIGSIIAIILIIVYIVLLILDEVRRDIPTVTSNSDFLELPTYTLFPAGEHADLHQYKRDESYEQFLYGIKNKTSSSWISLDDFSKYFSISISLKNEYEEIKEKYSSLDKCPSKINFTNDEEYTAYDISQIYCVNGNIPLVGSDDNFQYQYLEIQLNRTQEDSDEINYEDFIFYFFYTNTIFNQTDIDHPLQTYIDWKFMELSDGLSPDMIVYFSRSKITTYYNMIPKKLTKKKNQEYFTIFDNERYTTKPKSSKDITMLTVKVFASPIYTEYELTYTSIFAIIGRIGGFGQFVILIIGFFVMYSSNIREKERLINDIYLIIDPTQQKKLKEELNLCKTKIPEYFKKIAPKDKDFDKDFVDLTKTYGDYIYLFLKEIDEMKNDKNQKKEEPNYEGKSQEEINKDNFVNYFKDNISIIIDLLTDLIFNPKTETGNDIKSKEQQEKQICEKRLKLHGYIIVFVLGKKIINQGMRFTCCEVCTNFFCCDCCICDETHKKKNKIYKKAVNKLQKDADFVSLFNSLQKYEGIKQILLSSDTHIPLFKALANKPFYPKKDDLEEQNQKKNEELEEKKKQQTMLYNQLKNINENLERIVLNKADNNEIEFKLFEELLSIGRIETNINQIKELTDCFNEKESTESQNQ